MLYWKSFHLKRLLSLHFYFSSLFSSSFFQMNMNQMRTELSHGNWPRGTTGNTSKSQAKTMSARSNRAVKSSPLPQEGAIARRMLVMMTQSRGGDRKDLICQTRLTGEGARTDPQAQGVKGEGVQIMHMGAGVQVVVPSRMGKRARGANRAGTMGTEQPEAGQRVPGRSGKRAMKSEKVWKWAISVWTHRTLQARIV